MYKISEFCKMVGLPKSKIIFYEKRGLFDVKRKENGYRYYTHYDAFRVNAFLVLLQYGFSVNEAIRLLDQQQSNQEFVASLSNQKEALQHQIEILQYRIRRIDDTLFNIENHVENSFFIRELEPYLYTNASHGLDFSASITNARTLAKFYELLSVSRCSRIILKDELLGNAPEVNPSYIVAIPENAAYLLGDYNHSHVKRMELGKCLVTLRAKTRTDSVKRESFTQLLNYMEKNNLTVRDNILLLPTFLNLDSKGLDIETLVIPIH